MAYGNQQRKELEPGTILMFQNEDRRAGKEDPHGKGYGKDVGGTDVWVAGWRNISKKDGKPYWKIMLKPKQEERRETYERAQQEERPPAKDDFEF